MVKQYAAFMVALLFPVFLAAQTGSEGGKSSVESFDVDGVRVILSKADNELVSVIVGLEGGMASGETDNPALADLAAGVIAESGSEAYTKMELRKFVSRTSTRIDGGADRMGIEFSMTSTLNRFPEAWKVLSSIIRTPLFDANEFRNQKQRRLDQVKGSWTRPESYAYRITDSLVRSRHEFLGRYTVESDVEAVTLPAIETFYNRLKEKSRMLVVVVGNVTRDQVTTMVRDFGSWKQGDFKPVDVKPVEAAEAPLVDVIDNPGAPTTYIYAGFAGPSSTDEDYWPLAIGLSYLRDILFQEIRTKRNLSYAPSAFLSSSHGQSVGMLGVSTVWPDSSVKIMLHEFENMREGKFDEAALNDAKQVYTTRYYMQEMTNASKAARLYYSQRYSGDWTKAFSYEAIMDVDKDDVEDAFEKYGKNLRFGIVGNRGAITTSKYLFVEHPPSE